MTFSNNQIEFGKILICRKKCVKKYKWIVLCYIKGFKEIKKEKVSNKI